MKTRIYESSFGQRYAALIAQVADYQRANAEDRQAMVLGVEDILQELLDSGVHGYAFHLRKGQFVCLVAHNPDELGAADALARQIPEALRNYMSQPVRCRAGSPVKGLFNLYESYQSALEELDGPSAMPAWDSDRGTDFAPVLDKRLLRRLAELAHAKDDAEYQAASAQLIAAVRDCRPPSADHARGLYLLSLGNLIMGAAGDSIAKESVDIYANCLGRLQRCESEEALHRQMADLLPETRSALQPSQLNPADRVAAEIRRILDENLAENITIRELSRRVFLTPQYLCTVFKQRTGMTINDYVTGRRIERAKELLRSGRYKLYEIAPMVGYQDAKYFSRVFKRMTGMTPSDYQ